jgi:transposase-like protein
MGSKRHKPEEIVSKLRQVDVLVGQGMARVDAIREVSITEQTYYRWRRQYGGMGTDQLRQLKKLQKENEQLRKAVADLTIDKQILTEAARGNFYAPRVAGGALIWSATSWASPSAVPVACLASIDPRSAMFPGAGSMRSSSLLT